MLVEIIPIGDELGIEISPDVVQRTGWDEKTVLHVFEKVEERRVLLSTDAAPPEGWTPLMRSPSECPDAAVGDSPGTSR